MATPRRAASQERGRETQNRVLEGASRVFSAQGYGLASMRSISDAAGVPLGTINFHFGSKDQIALAIVEEQNRRATTTALEISHEYDSAIERLIHLSHALAVQLQNDEIAQAGVELTVQVGDFLDPEVRSRDGWRQAAVEQFALGLETGELVSELDAAELAETYLACFTGVHTLSRVRSNRADLLSEVRRLWLVIMLGLIAPDRREFARRALDEVFGIDHS